MKKNIRYSFPEKLGKHHKDCPFIGKTKQHHEIVQSTSMITVCHLNHFASDKGESSQTNQKSISAQNIFDQNFF